MRTRVLLGIIAAGVLAACPGRPPREQPAVTATLTWTGTPADRMEREVVLPLAAAFAKTARATSTLGLAVNGRAELVVRFEAGADAKSALAAVQETVRAVVPRLPSELAPAQIIPGEPREAAPLWLRIGGTSAQSLDLARTVMVPRIERVPGVRNAEVRGAAVMQATVRVDPVRLAAAGVTLAEVVAALSVRTATAVPPIGDLDAVVIGTTPAATPLVRLSEVARVALEPVRASTKEDLSIAVWLLPRTARTNVREAIAALPPDPALKGLTLTEMPAPDTMVVSPHVVELFGAKREEVEALANRLSRELVSEGLVTGANRETAPVGPATRTLAIDAEARLRQGVAETELAPLAGVLAGRPLVPARGTSPAVLVIADPVPQLQVRGTSGLIPLGSVATFTEQPDRALLTIDGQPAIVLRITLVSGVNLAQVRSALTKRNLTAPTAPVHARALAR